MVKNVLNPEEKGRELLQESISRFTSGNAKLKYNEPIKRQKVYTFEIPHGKKNSITEDKKESFESILLIFESQKLNLKYIMNWPLTAKPWAICKALGKTKANSKSLFLNSLLALFPSQPETFPPQTIKCCVVDVMRVVRKIPESDLGENTYTCWAKCFANYLSSLPGDEVHVVFDNYE